jgi:hypothetical protein
VLVLRRDTVEHPHFRIWTPIPIAGAVSCVLLMTQQAGHVWLFGGGLLALGLLLHFVTVLVRKREARRNPERVTGDE